MFLNPERNLEKSERPMKLAIADESKKGCKEDE